MVLEERKCPNCGAGGIIEKDGTYVCMNCRTFFDNPNDVRISQKIEQRIVTRDEAEIEKIRYQERSDKRNTISIVLWMLFLIGIVVFCLYKGGQL